MGYEDKNNWIWSRSWGGRDLEEPRILLFRRTVFLENEPEKSVLQVSADTRYKLYVNGNLAETGPCKGDRQVWFLDTVDIGKWLKKGGKCDRRSGAALSGRPGKGKSRNVPYPHTRFIRERQYHRSGGKNI